MRSKSYTVSLLEEGWEWEDLYNIDLVDYCTHELDIPQEYLQDALCGDQKLKLSLLTGPSYHNDDWFINLLRVAV